MTQEQETKMLARQVYTLLDENEATIQQVGYIAYCMVLNALETAMDHNLEEFGTDAMLDLFVGLVRRDYQKLKEKKRATTH